MRLNPAKCYNRVHAGKFLGFMLRLRGIKANPYKCQTYIIMWSPTNLKEMQQLTCRLAALSCFLSCAGDKAFLFFTALKKKERFEWTFDCEEAFTKFNNFLSSPPVLTRLKDGSSLLLYLSITD